MDDVLNIVLAAVVWLACAAIFYRCTIRLGAYVLGRVVEAAEPAITFTNALASNYHRSGLAFAELTEKYEMMTRAREVGAMDGMRNVPDEAAAAMSPTELQIIQLAQADLGLLTADQQHKNDSFGQSLRALTSNLPTASPENLRTFEANVHNRLLAVEKDLVRLYEIFLARAREYRFFKAANKLRRDADLPDSGYVAWASLLFIIVVNGVANAYFLKDANANALLGGFLVPFCIAVINAVMGFVTGALPVRFFNHSNRLHLLWALPAFSTMFAAIAGFNLAIAHYGELLAERPDAHVMDLLSRMRGSLFGLNTLGSWVLVGIGFCIAMLAISRGYTIFDTYPGYGWAFKRRQRARQEFDNKSEQIREEIDLYAQAYLAQAKASYDRAHEVLQKAISETEHAVTNKSRAADALLSIESAVNEALRFYRRANLQVRNDPPPAYFSKEHHLDLNQRQQILDTAELQGRREEFLKLDREIKAQSEKLSKAISEAARNFISEGMLNERLERIKAAAEKAGVAGEEEHGSMNVASGDVA